MQDDNQCDDGDDDNEGDIVRPWRELGHSEQRHCSQLKNN